MSLAPIRIGVAGFGSAGRTFVPAIRSHRGFALAAIAEPAVALHDEIGAQCQVPVFADLARMLSGCELDAVYIATPTTMHEEHVLRSLAAGKHVLVEKPMAINVSNALRMVDAARTSGRAFVVGHSHGFDEPVRAMRRLIEQGDLGRVRMVSTACYTDWMYRPRRPDELDVSQGGGVIYRQGSHQFDMLRVLCGGQTRSIRARTFDWNRERPGVGAHAAWLEFEDGTLATATYNGYGNFPSTEICFGIGEMGFPASDGPSLRARARGQSAPQDVAAAKQARARETHAQRGRPPHQPFFGLTLVSCENGDIRQSPDGLFVYSGGERRELALSNEKGPRDLVLDELHEAIVTGRPALHDAHWGLANLELCDAAIESSRTGREVTLSHQVGLHR